MSLGKNVRLLREARGWDQLALSKASGVKVGTISALEVRNSRRSDAAPALAAALGVTIEALMSDQLASPMSAAPPPSAQAVSNVAPARMGTTAIPLISRVQAGSWCEVADPYQLGDGSDWLVTDLKVSRSTFALEVQGDSMLPDFKPGDHIIVDPEVQPLPGDFVVAKNGSEEATFKKYRPRGANEAGEQVFELVPLNEDYPSMRSDLVHIRIIGTMVEHRQYRKR